MNIIKKAPCKIINQAMKKYKFKQREFERKLQFNTNSDPLDLWYKHIVWICEHSESINNFEKLVTQIIENCIESFVQNKKYTNDERFFDIFLKYTRLVCDPLEIYESLNSIQLFEKISEFYINWAWLLENSLKYNKSLEVLNLGIERKAKPIQSLIEAKTTLENKMQNVTFSLDKTEDEDKKSNKLSLKINSFNKNLDENNKFNQIRKLENSNLKNSPKKEFFNFTDENKINLFTPNKNGKIKSSVFIEKTEIFSAKLTSTPFKILEDVVCTKTNEVKLQSKENQLKLSNNLNTNNKSENENIEYKNEKAKAFCDVEKKENQVFKEPKLVIFEVLKPNQKFYADLKKIYVGQTEYSFEELRFNKILNEKKEKDSENQLLKEIKELRNQLIKAEEEKKRENDNLQKQLDYYKQKLDFLLSTISVTQNVKRSLDQVDFNKNDDSKKKKINCEDNFKTKNVEKELTIVREMWNGTLENNSNISGDCKNLRDFTIYKDPSQTAYNFKHTSDFIVHPPFNLTSGDLNTIQLPSDTFEFTAKMSSTPFVQKKKKKHNI